MPPGKLDVTVLGAKNLVNTQTFGHQDPFFVVKCGDRHFTSEIAHDAGKNPTWNARFSFDLVNEDTIYFTIRNRNVITSDALLGNVQLNLNTAFTEGKHDAVAPVITGAGTPQGELSVILLFATYETEKKNKDKNKQSESSTTSRQYVYGSNPPMTGFLANPGTPTQQTPSAPPFPAVSPAQARYPVSGSYPPQQGGLGYPPVNMQGQQLPEFYSHQGHCPPSTTYAPDINAPPFTHPGSQQPPPSGYVGGPYPPLSAYAGSQQHPPPGYPVGQQPPYSGYQGNQQRPLGYSAPTAPPYAPTGSYHHHPQGGLNPGGYPRPPPQNAYFGPSTATFGQEKHAKGKKHSKKNKKKSKFW